MPSDAAKGDGAAGLCPGDLLKLYLYGYPKGHRQSAPFETEAMTICR